MDEIKYEEYGVNTTDDAITLTYVAPSGAIGSRLYVLQEEEYVLFKLKNREFAFDINITGIDCALNGVSEGNLCIGKEFVAHGTQAVYFVEMDKTGGKGKGGNTAGALFGTGYCDAQCPADVRFIEGAANMDDWVPENKTGKLGACCNEFDVWEGNKQAEAVATHSCKKKGHFVCDNGEDCGRDEYKWKGLCDGPGCDFNEYRMGSKNFYGPGMTVDSNKIFTLVTQFITSNNKDDGDLQEIRRFFVQGGTVIPDTNSTYTKLSSISDDYCDQLNEWTGDTNHHEELGGLATMGEAFDRGMVLTISLWDDFKKNMIWLDAFDQDPHQKAGGLRGRCDQDADRSVETLRETYGPVTLTYSNIRFGPLATTTEENLGDAVPSGGSPAGAPAPPSPDVSPDSSSGGSPVGAPAPPSPDVSPDSSLGGSAAGAPAPPSPDVSPDSSSGGSPAGAPAPPSPDVSPDSSSGGSPAGAPAPPSPDVSPDSSSGGSPAGAPAPPSPDVSPDSSSGGSPVGAPAPPSPDISPNSSSGGSPAPAPVPPAPGPSVPGPDQSSGTKPSRPPSTIYTS